LSDCGSGDVAYGTETVQVTLLRTLAYSP